MTINTPEDEYKALCEYYNEDMKLTPRGTPDSDGEHARQLRERFYQEKFASVQLESKGPCWLIIETPLLGTYSQWMAYGAMFGGDGFHVSRCADVDMYRIETELAFAGGIVNYYIAIDDVDHFKTDWRGWHLKHGTDCKCPGCTAPSG